MGPSPDFLGASCATIGLIEVGGFNQLPVVGHHDISCRADGGNEVGRAGFYSVAKIALEDGGIIGAVVGHAGEFAARVGHVEFGVGAGQNGDDFLFFGRRCVRDFR